MFFKFIAGNKINHAIIKSEKLLKNKKIPIINYICENVQKNDEYNIYSEYKNLLNNVNSNYILALKLSSLNFNINLINKIAHISSKKNIKLIIDAEDNENIEKYRKLTNILIKDFNKEKPNIIKTYQMYRKDSLDELNNDIQYFTKNLFNKNVCLFPKLVRGAYWNSEKNGQHLFVKKENTNNNYNIGLIKCYNNLNNIILATHNKESINLANNLINNEKIIIAHLMGMNENNMNNMNNMKTACYIPYGPYNKMLPYLSRRLYENIDQIKFIF